MCKTHCSCVFLSGNATVISFRDSPKFYYWNQTQPPTWPLDLVLTMSPCPILPAAGPSVSQHFPRQHGKRKRLWLWGIGSSWSRDGSASASLLAHGLDWTNFTNSWPSPTKIQIKCLFHTDWFTDIFFYFWPEWAGNETQSPGVQ